MSRGQSLLGQNGIVNESGTRSRVANIPETAIRILFLVFALVALWGGIARWNVWAEASLEGRRSSVANWLIWLAIVALAGFFFGLAAVPPTTLRYRIGPPLLLATIPVLLLAHTILLYGVRWEGLSHFLATPRFYMNSPFQFGLATWVGIALVSGFHSGAVRYREDV